MSSQTVTLPSAYINAPFIFLVIEQKVQLQNFLIMPNLSRIPHCKFKAKLNGYSLETYDDSVVNLIFFILEALLDYICFPPFNLNILLAAFSGIVCTVSPSAT